MNCVKIVSSKNIEYYDKSFRGIEIKKIDLLHISLKLDINRVTPNIYLKFSQSKVHNITTHYIIFYIIVV